jgi:tRNA(Ile)-lysidine synthase
MLSLESKLAEAWPPADWADVTVVAAVSGGCDSVALLRALKAIQVGGTGRICVAHLNHHLRADSDLDEAFVVELCRTLDVACEVGHVAVGPLANASGDGIEAAARAARYDFLETTAGRFGARFVATAHTADDQAETILHRIVRGTGLRGLSGMARVRLLGHATLIRPLLDVRRPELLDYLDALGQPYRHDPSNADVRFTRNRIRHETMPHLCEQFNCNVAEALLRLGTLAGEAQAVIDPLGVQRFERCVTIDDSTAARVALSSLAAEPRYLVPELLMAEWLRQGWPMQAMGLPKWEELCELAMAAAAPVQRDFPSGVTVSVAEGQMTLRRSSCY